MIFNSSFYVAIVIAMLNTFCQIIFFDKINFKIILFTFLSGFLFYQTKSIKIQTINKYKFLSSFLVTSYLAFFFFLDFLFKLNFFYFFLFGLAFLYRFKIKGFSFRTIPYLKPFIIAFVICGFSILFINFSDYCLKNFDIFFNMCCSIFFFLLGIAILSDLKDIDSDKTLSLKTFANSLTLNGFKFFVLFCFMCSFLLLKNINTQYFLIKMSFSITLLISSILVIALKKQNKDFYYTWLIDGCLSLPLITYYILSSF